MLISDGSRYDVEERTQARHSQYQDNDTAPPSQQVNRDDNEG